MGKTLHKSLEGDTTNLIPSPNSPTVSRKTSIDPLIGASHSKILDSRGHESLLISNPSTRYLPRFRRRDVLEESINADLFFFLCFVQESSSLLSLQAFSLYFFGRITWVLLGISFLSYLTSQFMLFRSIPSLVNRFTAHEEIGNFRFSNLRLGFAALIRALGIAVVSVFNLILLGIAFYYLQQAQTQTTMDSFISMILNHPAKLFFLTVAILVFVIVRSTLGSTTIFQRQIDKVLRRETRNFQFDFGNKLRSFLLFFLYSLFLSYYTSFASSYPLIGNLLILILSYGLSYIDNRFLLRGFEKQRNLEELL